MVKFKKSDSYRFMESYNKGNVVSMTSTLFRGRSELNDRLYHYFNRNSGDIGVIGSFDEDVADGILDVLNEYVRINKLDVGTIEFPQILDFDIWLLPITENLELKVLVSDDYLGDGDYEKYVMVDEFMITENASERDVDRLIEALRKIDLLLS